MILAIVAIIYSVLYLKLAEWIVLALIISLIVLLIAFFIILYMCLNEEAGKRITLWIVRVIKRFSRKEHPKIERKALDAMRGFQDSIRVMIKDRNVLMYGLPLSFIIWLFEILRVYVVFAAFGAHVSLGVIAAVFVIATLIGMIPLLPGGLGAVDGIMILMYSIAGVPPSISAAATIVERLISFWMTSFIGMAVLPYFGTGVMEKFSDELK
ncbi:MAG: flippase-like domain-containing protein [Methanobacterium paludis]|nr:flippase-like domain-containing protein [Methanobacterium paludis]